jgi:thiosulfate/3-mercaptopyruvate sulfurtransferase
VWWLLKYAGVPDARILNGGMIAYKQEKGELSDQPTTATAEPATWTPDPNRMASKADVLAAIKDGSATVVDARTTDEHAGTADTAKRNGHIPGATHLEWEDVLDPTTRKFVPPAKLISLMGERKIDPAKPCVTYCQGGGRAAVLAFTIELMGGTGVKNYYRSWGEWGNDPDTPVIKK